MENIFAWFAVRMDVWRTDYTRVSPFIVKRKKRHWRRRTAKTSSILSPIACLPTTLRRGQLLYSCRSCSAILLSYFTGSYYCLFLNNVCIQFGDLYSTWKPSLGPPFVYNANEEVTTPPTTTATASCCCFAGIARDPSRQRRRRRQATTVVGDGSESLQ